MKSISRTQFLAQLPSELERETLLQKVEENFDKEARTYCEQRLPADQPFIPSQAAYTVLSEYYNSQKTTIPTHPVRIGRFRPPPGKLDMSRLEYK